MIHPFRLCAAGLVLAYTPLFADPSLTVHLDDVKAKISPTLYGLMTEEINHAYDGGLYAELIQNRVFLDDATTPVHWSVLPGDKPGAIALDSVQPLSAALPTSLRLDGPTRVENDGFWGVALRPATKYRASLYARGDEGTSITLQLTGADGQHVLASAQVGPLHDAWGRFEAVLTTPSDLTASVDNRFVIESTGSKTWVNLVSLFPPTFNDRPNGTRPDLMEMMAGLHPTFLRLPGGNFLEGDHVATRFNWKETIGPLTDRPGNPGCWKYRTSYGLGLLEFLEWCEDLHVQPVLAVYSGYSLKQEYVKPGPDLEPFVQEDLDEIEYVTGDAKTTKWGQRRAADGHPEPFPLQYVEIGNEDFYDQAKTYDARFAQIYDALKAKYPDLKYIATRGITSRKPDVIDYHAYRSAAAMETENHRFDTAKRDGPKLMVGEWATVEGTPTPNLNAALGDAAWMTGLERNSDVVILTCYAPLLVNVNTKPQAWQWGTNLIGYDGLNCFGSPSYYVQQMFASHLGDVVLDYTLDGVPTEPPPPVPPPKNPNVKPKPPLPPVPQIHAVVTRDSTRQLLFVKLVNVNPQPEELQLNFTGAGHLAPDGTAITLSGTDPKAVNSLAEPQKIVPVTSPVHGVSTAFKYTLPGYSVTVLQLNLQ
jgi:alpha-N-arabinofuranosidase